MRRTVLALLTLILTVCLWTPLAFADKRVALVIGNSAYQHVPALLNPANDASDLATALRALGFEVIEAHDLNQTDMLATVRRFSQAAEGADTGLFFYAGHGLQVAGINYLVPIDAKLVREGDLAFEAIKLDFILEQLERETKTALIFLDACRDNPMAQYLARSMGSRSASLGRGLARVDSGVGTFIAFSTQPGNVALDGQGRNSPFTGALVKHIGDPDKDLGAVMIAVRNDVYAATDGKQVPWENSSLRSQFFFRPSESVVSNTGATTGATIPSTPIIPKADPAAEAWAAAKDTTSIGVLEAYIAKFGDSFYTEMAKAKLADLKEKERAKNLADIETPGAIDSQTTLQYVVQVGAKQNQTEALATFADMQQKYPTLLARYRPMVQKADLGFKGVWYRLRIGPIATKEAASKLCSRLKSQGHPDCLVMAAQPPQSLGVNKPKAVTRPASAFPLD